MMRYVNIPKELTISEIRSNGACLSPGRYVRFIPPDNTSSTQFAELDKLVLLRDTRVITKKDKVYKYAEIGDIEVSTGGITFNTLRGYQLPTNKPLVARKGDVLVSTVRTYRKGIGYVTDDGDNLVTTNAVMNICGLTDFIPDLTLPYLYSFLRTDFFVEQVWSMLNRGLYPRMDKGALDKILIPIPSSKETIRYVTSLMKAIVEKEIAIREKSNQIHLLILAELMRNQKRRDFQFNYPSISEILPLGRLDAVIFDQEYKSKIWLIENYTYGYETPRNAGFTIIPGPSLEIKLLRTRIDTNVYRPDYYTLILPKNISIYGTMNIIQFLGTPKKLPLLEHGDIVFGEAGFQKGRSIVLLDNWPKCTTNAHGLYARRTDGDIYKSIFFRCIFNWYRSMRLIDMMAVGGSGGHFSPTYFDYVRIPKFPDSNQLEIVKLYHNDVPGPLEKITLENFIDWHRRWNNSLGISELDREMKALQLALADIQEKIIKGTKVEIP